MLTVFLRSCRGVCGVEDVAAALIAYRKRRDGYLVGCCPPEVIVPVRGFESRKHSNLVRDLWTYIQDETCPISPNCTLPHNLVEGRVVEP